MSRNKADQEEIEVHYNPAFEPCFLSQHRYLIMKGGAGSGKSVCAAQKVVGRTVGELGHRFLVLRKVSNTIKQSVWQLVLDVFESFGHAHLIAVNKTDRVITYIPNGNQILFAGVDDPEKMKSIVGITGLWFEEITEFDEADLRQGDLRLRGETLNYKQIIGTFNPVDVGHWLKARFFDTTNDKVLTHESNYKDNLFIDDEYKHTLETQFRSDPNDYSIYVLNQWGNPRTGLEIYTNFDLNKHVIEDELFRLDPEAPIHLTFDFNVFPHVTVNAWQFKTTDDDENPQTTATQFDEFCLTHPLNDTSSAAKAFLERYGDHDGGLWVYGDPSGRSRDTRSEEGRNDFTIIFDILKDMEPIDRVQSVAPNVNNRVKWVNKELFDDGQLKLRICQKCKVAINDLQHVKRNAEGGKLKKRIKDKLTGVSYEEFGHSTDANEYFLTTAFDTFYSEYLQGGAKPSELRTFDRTTRGSSKGF